MNESLTKLRDYMKSRNVVVNMYGSAAIALSMAMKREDEA